MNTRNKKQVRKVYINYALQRFLSQFHFRKLKGDINLNVTSRWINMCRGTEKQYTRKALAAIKLHISPFSR